MRARLTVLACTLSLIVAGSAAAQDKAGAAVDAKQASGAASQKHFSEASGLYLSAYAKSKDAKYLFSAASASQKDGQSAAAANLYARYLREAPEKAPSRKVAKKELDGLAPKLAQLVIRADGARSVTLDGAPLDLPLAPVVFASTDPHQLAGTFDAGPGNASVTAPAATPTNVVLVATPPASPPAPAPVVVAKPEPPTVIKEEKRKPLPPAVVFVGAGLTIVAGGLTIASAIDTNHQKSKFDSEGSQENLDSGRDKEKRTNILLGATAGLAVLTGVTALLLVDWKGKPKNVAVDIGPGAFAVSGTF